MELTHISGILNHLEDKPGISIMADRGFTIKDMLAHISGRVNIPAFMEGRKKLSPDEVQEGRKITSLIIHVERAIGRMKTFAIPNDTLPLSLARLYNQIVCVCTFLSNFRPVLVPLEAEVNKSEELDVDAYFEGWSDDSEHDRDD